MTKLKNSNCDKTQKFKFYCCKHKQSNCDKTQILTVVIVTVVTVALVTVVIMASFSKNKLTPQQPLRCSRCRFSQFLQCFEKL